MPRKSATFVSKDDTTTSRGADSSEQKSAPRRSGRASAKKEQISAGEGRRSRRSSTTPQTPTESRVTRSRNSVTSRKEVSGNNFVASKESLETPAPRVRPSRRSTGRVNYKESDGEEELPVAGSDKGYTSDISFELDSGGSVTNKKRKSVPPQQKSLSSSKAMTNKMNVSTPNQQNSGIVSEFEKSTVYEENIEKPVLIRKRSRDTESVEESDSLQLRRSSRRSRQISESVESESNEASGTPKNFVSRENTSKRPIRGKAKSKVEVSDELHEPFASAAAHDKCEKTDIGNSPKHKMDLNHSETNKRLKLSGKDESTSAIADAKDEAMEDLAIQDEIKGGFVSERECTIHSELVEGTSSVQNISASKESSVEMDIDEPLNQPNTVTDSTVIIKKGNCIGDDTKSFKETSDVSNGMAIPSTISFPETEDVNQNSHSSDCLSIIECCDSEKENKSDNSNNEMVEENLPPKEEYSEMVNDKSNTGSHILASSGSESANQQSNNFEKSEKDNKQTIVISEISSNAGEVVLKESDKIIESGTETKTAFPNENKCVGGKPNACLEGIDLESTKTNDDKNNAGNVEITNDAIQNHNKKNVKEPHDTKNVEMLEKNSENVNAESAETCIEGSTEPHNDGSTGNCNKEDAENLSEKEVVSHTDENSQVLTNVTVEECDKKDSRDCERSAESLNIASVNIKTHSEMRNETNVGANNSSDIAVHQVCPTLETSLNGSEPNDKSAVTTPNTTMVNALEVNAELFQPEDNASAKANGSQNSSHVAGNTPTKEGLFFFPGRRYVLNPSMSEEIRFSLKNRMFGFASFNLGSKIKNCFSQKDKLISELRKLQTDIICLQEITKSFFNDILEPSLDALGYKGVIHVPEENLTGLASFYKKSTFRLSGFSEASLLKLIEKDLEASSLDCCDKKAVLSYMKKCGNVLLTQFCTVSDECTLTVANVLIPPSDISTHALQMSCLVREVVTMIEGSTKPLLLCGAFNMAEDEAAYQLLRDGYLSNEMIEELQKEKDVNLPGKENAALINLLWKAFQHPSSNLCSCYESVLGHELLVPGTRKPTAPDLLWFSSDCLRTVGVLDVLSAPLEKTEDFHYSLKATVAFALPRK